MDLLLDTHTFLWFGQDNAQLSPYAKLLLMDGRNQRFLSAASIWEMAIKVSNGKLNLQVPLEDFLSAQFMAQRISLVPIEIPHVVRVSAMLFSDRTLPHHDPFDRLIIAQSLTLNMPVVGNDTVFDAYGVRRLW